MRPVKASASTSVLKQAVTSFFVPGACGPILSRSFVRLSVYRVAAMVAFEIVCWVLPVRMLAFRT